VKRIRKIIRVTMVVFISIIGAVSLVFITLNLPFSHRFAASQVNRIFVRTDLPIHIRSIRTLLPHKLRVEGVCIKGVDGDTLIYAGELKARIGLPGLLRAKVELKKVEIDHAMVDLSRMEGEENLDIAEAFSSVGKSNSNTQEQGKKSWEISISTGNLTDISFRFKDIPGGIDIEQVIEKSKLRDFTFSIGEKSIQARSAEFAGSEGGMVLSPVRLATAEESEPSWIFGVRDVSLQNFGYTYENTGDSLLLKIDLAEGEIRTRSLDLPGKHIDIEKIALSQAVATMLSGNKPGHGATDEANGPNIKEAPGNFQWEIQSGKINLEESSILLGQYPENDESSSDQGFRISEVDANLSGIILSKERTGVTIESLQFDIGNGFSLKKMEGSLESESGHIMMAMSIETGNSQINLEGEASGDFFDLLESPGQMSQAHVSLNQTNLSGRDLAFFMDELQQDPLFSVLARIPIQVKGELLLSDSRLTLSEFSFSQPGNVKVNLTGTAEDPFHPDLTRMKLALEIPSVNAVWLEEMLTIYGIGDMIAGLDEVAIRGSLASTYRTPEFDLDLRSNKGNIGVSGSIRFEDQSYSIHADLDRLMLGELLSVQDLGTLSGTGDITGQGFKRENLAASANLTIDSLHYREHNYTLTNVQGIFRPDFFEMDVVTDDPSLKGSLRANLYPSDSAFSAEVTGSLFAQLNELQLYEDTLAIESGLQASIIRSENAMRAELNLSDIKLKTPREEADVEQISAIFQTDSLRTGLSAEAEFLHVEAEIDVPIDSLGSLKKAYGNYFRSVIDPQYENASMRVTYLPEMNIQSSILYHEAMDILIKDTTVHFSNLDFLLINRISDHKIQYHLMGNDLEYKMLQIGDLDATLVDSAGILDLQVLADDNLVYASNANNLLLSSRFEDLESLSTLSVLDKHHEIVYRFEVSTRVDSNQLVLNIPSRQLILNKNAWDLESPDLLTVDLKSRTINPSLEIHQGDSRIRIHSEGDEGVRQLSVNLEDVEIETLLTDSLIQGNPHGSISGSVKYHSEEGGHNLINSELRINSASWSGLKFDLISLDGTFDAENEGDYLLDMTVRLDTSEISFSAEKQDSILLSAYASFRNVPIKTVQPFVKDYLSDIRGVISGGFDISTDRSGRQFDGGMVINNANLRVNALNSRFKIPRDSLVFDGRKLVFNHFRVLDSLNNDLQVNGYVDFNDERSITTDLEISSSRLHVMNKGNEEDDASFYGNAIVDSRLTLKGPVNSPVIKGKILLSRGSELYYRHTEDLNLSESEKIITFVDYSEDAVQPGPVQRSSRGTMNRTSIETIVEIDPSTSIHFNLSKRIYNINLEIRGGGSLNYQMLKNNQMLLSGRYEISEGSADVKMVGWPKKSFRITEGGYVQWDGLPENPELKFEAVSRVRTSYINPVDGKRREVDFNVVLQLANRLSELDIIFKINTPDQYLMSIINTLSPEEQMKQAITVLLFENIDLPGISTNTAYMTEQVNQLVASQLNQLTKTTISGVDISFGIDSYVEATEGGGEQTKTSLSYEVRKGLMNERGQIEVSGRLNDLNNQPGTSDLSINNVSFEYRLDSAATKYLKVYNEHTYEDVFEGEVISTGIGIRYRKRYSMLRDIWKRDPNKRKKKEKNRRQ
jgi:hypothetical protein